MRYFVIAPDGNRYGPADIALLNQWVQQGRLTAASLLEVEGTQQRVLAQNVPGLILNAPMAVANPYAGFGQPAMGYPAMLPYDDGLLDMRKCWRHLAFSIFCLPIVFNISGAFLALRALRKGNMSGFAGIIVHGVVGIFMLQVVRQFYAFLSSFGNLGL